MGILSFFVLFTGLELVRSYGFESHCRPKIYLIINRAGCFDNMPVITKPIESTVSFTTVPETSTSLITTSLLSVTSSTTEIFTTVLETSETRTTTIPESVPVFTYPITTTMSIGITSSNVPPTKEITTTKIPVPIDSCVFYSNTKFKEKTKLFTELKPEEYGLSALITKSGYDECCEVCFLNREKCHVFLYESKSSKCLQYLMSESIWHQKTIINYIDFDFKTKNTIGALHMYID